MHKRTSTSMSPVDLFADNATSLIIGNDSCTINIAACVASLFIGERSSKKTKHARCFYQDTLIIGTVRQDIIPSHPSSLMDIHLHDFTAITSVVFVSTQRRRIFLPWGAAPSNCTPIALQIIYVRLHDLVSYEATTMDNSKFYDANSTVDCEDGDTSSTDVYSHDTAWGAADKSLLVPNTAIASATTEVGKHGLAGSIKRQPCTSLVNGEHLLPAQLHRCLRERLLVHLQHFYCHLIVGKYQCDVSSYPWIVFQDLADQCSRRYDMCRAHFLACNIFHCHEAIGKDTVLVFDIEAWGGYCYCHFYKGRRSHYMPVDRMLTDGQLDGTDRLHDPTYSWGDASCVSYELFDTFDLALTGSDWILFQHGKSSKAHFLTTLSARFGNGIIISWVGSGAISPVIGIGNRTINNNARCVLRIDGEPKIYILRDRIISEFWDLVSCELCSADYAERWSSKNLQHLIYVGCSLKTSITTTSCRRNDSIGLTVGNAMRDISSVRFISVPFLDGHDQLQLHDQLQVQVTTAHRLQVQVTCDISFANSHITSSFASCDDSLNISSWMALWGEETLAEKMIVAKEELWGEMLEATIEVMTGERRFGFGYVDVLHKRWRYSYTNFSLFVGLILLMLRVMGSHILQIVDLDISISCRWGVTAGKLGYLICGRIYGLSLICKYTGTFW